jgi:hypothetical protein
MKPVNVGKQGLSPEHTFLNRNKLLHYEKSISNSNRSIKGKRVSLAQNINFRKYHPHDHFK